jgi:hypothetical protein
LDPGFGAIKLSSFVKTDGFLLRGVDGGDSGRGGYINLEAPIPLPLLRLRSVLRRLKYLLRLIVFLILNTYFHFILISEFIKFDGGDLT